jgi:hypothetical protein
MNDRQEAKLNMLQTVSDTCHQYEQVYSDVPAFVGNIGQLKSGITEIRKAAQQQAGTTTKGVTATKAVAMDKLVQQGVKVANSLYVYAFTTDNQPLLAKVSVNKRMFYNGHDNDALTLAKNIADEASAYTVELQDYGIDAVELTALNDLIADYQIHISHPQTNIGEHKLHTANLKQLFADVDSVLYDRLDKLIVLFKVSAPDFYARYKSARNVINTAQRSRKKNEEN